MFPYLVLISISSFIGALFNANGRFAMWAFSPIILNLGMIIALGVSYFYFAIPELILSWAVIISGILQLLVMIFWSLKINIKIKFSKPKVSKNIKDAILRKATTLELKEVAIKDNFRTMQDMGRELI